jgi:hypothetical protein
MSAQTTSQAEQLKRRSQRLVLRIPVEVSGKDANGAPFREKTHTLAVNRHGARIALTAAVRLHAAVTITNVTSMKSALFTVVSCAEKPVSGAPEWGVECLDLDPNFWGLYFPDEPAKTSLPDVMDVVLECSRCHSKEAGRMTAEQYRTFGAQPVLRRECPKCGTSAEWTLSIARGENGIEERLRPGVPPSSAVRADRRIANRVSIKLPVRIRMEDVGETENISKTGVCFSSTLDLVIGARVWLTVGYSPGSHGKEVAARVVWKQRMEGQQRALYGVELEGERE